MTRAHSLINAENIPSDLLDLQRLVFAPCGFKFSEPLLATESQEYGACSFELNGHRVQFRVAKITPTKVGQFVTVWKRTGKGPIQPFDLSDSVDLFVIAVRSESRFGVFVFPKALLCEQDIVSSHGKGGKRGIRVYPPWDVTTSRQAQKTQLWQGKYFLRVPAKGVIDSDLAGRVFF